MEYLVPQLSRYEEERNQFKEIGNYTNYLPGFGVSIQLVSDKSMNGGKKVLDSSED